jgi:TonB-linked SusC/RagA family outer membrane protein
MQGFLKLTVLGVLVLAYTSLSAQQQDSVTIATIQTSDKGVTVTGVITDAATKKPLPAINISIPGYSAALTDDNGKFTIAAPDYKVTLFVTAEGFQSKEIALKGRKIVSASLYEERFTSIYDNINLPIGVKPQNQAVHAIGSVNTEGNWNRNNEIPDSYLQGKVAGLQPIMRSGTPNAGAYMLLRGYNSLYGTNQPLIIVDGMIFDTEDIGASLISGHYTNALATIDVKDIESITVIKDAVSTYGTKAANGVILITTTHVRQLATRIDAAIYGGINFRPKELPVMKASDYRVYLSDVLQSRGWVSDQIQGQPYMNDDPSNPDYYRYHNETDWQDQVMENSPTSNMYLKVTGGDNIAKYALSMGYMKNAGIITNTGLTKYNVRFNGDLNLSRRLTSSANLSYAYYEQDLKDQALASKTSPLYLALTKAPFLHTNEVSETGAVSPNIAETDILGVGNPLAAVNSIKDNSKVYRFFGSINFKYQLTKAVSLYSLVGVNVNEVREQTFVPRKGIANDSIPGAIADSRLGGQAKRLFALYNDTYVDYTKTFNRVHKLQARAGVRYLSYKNEQDNQNGFNSATDQFISVGTGISTLRRTGGDFGQYNWLNTYLGADYSLHSKYFLSYNMAFDASSRFGSDIPNALNVGGANLAVLPSVGISWIISSENFMASNHFFDLLKLRASYGKTGNDDIGNYTSKQLYVSQNLLGLQGLVRSNIANPALQWESNTKANLGLDATIFKERISISVDIYQNKTDHMLAYEPVNPASGYNYAITNSGAMKTRGTDLSLNARIINTKSVKWDLGILLSEQTNRVTKLPGNAIFSSFGGATILTAVGLPADIFWGYKTGGVYATDAEATGIYKRVLSELVPFRGGDVRFLNAYDAPGDTLANGTRVTVIDENDRTHIGNPNPDFTGGFSNRISYKNFSFEALFTFSKGNKVYNGVRAALESGATTNNQLESMTNRWRAPGQITNIPKATYGDPLGNSSFSDRWIEDGSFIRLKYVSLSYTFPFKQTSLIKSSTIYITSNNLFTFTKYLGYDPEFQAAESILARGIDIGLEPNHRSVIAGIRIGL